MNKPKPTKQSILDSAKRCQISKDFIIITKVDKCYSVLIYNLECSNFITDLERLGYNAQIENIFSHPVKVNIKSYE